MSLLVAVVGSWVAELDEGETEMWAMVGHLSDLFMDWPSKSNCICPILSDFLCKTWQLHFFCSVRSSSEVLRLRKQFYPAPLNRGGEMTMGRYITPSCLQPALRGPSLNSSLVRQCSSCHAGDWHHLQTHLPDWLKRSAGSLGMSCLNSLRVSRRERWTNSQHALSPIYVAWIHNC